MLQLHLDSEQQVASSYIEQQEQEKADVPLQWTRSAVLTLINLYCERREDFSNPRIKQKQIWEKLAGKLEAQGFQVTPQQVETKWRGLIRTFKKMKDWNSKSGNKTRYWEYYTVMQEAIGVQPQISPVAECSTSAEQDPACTITSASAEKSSDSCTPTGPSGSSSSSFGKRKRETVVDVMNKVLHELQERRRERQEERKALLDVLKTISEKL